MQIIVNNKNSQISCQRLPIIYLLFYIVRPRPASPESPGNHCFIRFHYYFCRGPFNSNKQHKKTINDILIRTFQLFSPFCCFFHPPAISIQRHTIMSPFLLLSILFGFNWGKFVPFINRTLSFFSVGLMRNSLIWEGDINCFFYVRKLWLNFFQILKGHKVNIINFWYILHICHFHAFNNFFHF